MASGKAKHLGQGNINTIYFYLFTCNLNYYFIYNITFTKILIRTYVTFCMKLGNNEGGRNKKQIISMKIILLG